jgi:hypothetical protein
MAQILKIDEMNHFIIRKLYGSQYLLALAPVDSCIIDINTLYTVHNYDRMKVKYSQDVEKIVLSYGGRAHWGKMFFSNFSSHPEFWEYRDMMDPNKKFMNEYTTAIQEENQYHYEQSTYELRSGVWRILVWSTIVFASLNFFPWKWALRWYDVVWVSLLLAATTVAMTTESPVWIISCCLIIPAQLSLDVKTVSKVQIIFSVGSGLSGYVGFASLLLVSGFMRLYNTKPVTEINPRIVKYVLLFLGTLIHILAVEVHMTDPGHIEYHYLGIEHGVPGGYTLFQYVYVIILAMHMIYDFISQNPILYILYVGMTVGFCTLSIVSNVMYRDKFNHGELYFQPVAAGCMLAAILPLKRNGYELVERDFV